MSAKRRFGSALFQEAALNTVRYNLVLRPAANGATKRQRAWLLAKAMHFLLGSRETRLPRAGRGASVPIDAVERRQQPEGSGPRAPVADMDDLLRQAERDGERVAALFRRVPSGTSTCSSNG